MTSKLTINRMTGLLDPVNYVHSSHQDQRPMGVDIDMIVIHNISLPPKQFGTGAVQQFFCGQLPIADHPYFESIASLKVSAHLFLERTGKITQFVPFTARAWHAGQSSFQGRMQCNNYSIGIELEGTDDLPYEKCQYQQLSKIIRVLLKNYPNITTDRIVGHADIAPDRKTDPGASFDWCYLRGLLL